MWLRLLFWLWLGVVGGGCCDVRVSVGWVRVGVCGWVGVCGCVVLCEKHTHTHTSRQTGRQTDAHTRTDRE